MICPNCRSEIGNQPVCPYCGNVLASGRTVDYDYAAQQKTIPIFTQPTITMPTAAVQNTGRSTNKQLAVVDLRSKLTLVFSIGVFIMQIITLVILAIK